jgi:hypothetical protein
LASRNCWICAKKTGKKHRFLIFTRNTSIFSVCIYFVVWSPIHDVRPPPALVVEFHHVWDRDKKKFDEPSKPASAMRPEYWGRPASWNSTTSPGGYSSLYSEYSSSTVRRTGHPKSDWNFSTAISGKLWKLDRWALWLDVTLDVAHRFYWVGLLKTPPSGKCN